MYCLSLSLVKSKSSSCRWSLPLTHFPRYSPHCSLPGASGSYFYFTPRRHFIVKQISKGEKDNLLRIARIYLKHCCRVPGTTIHYYGLHSIRMPFTSKKQYFVVMKNFLFVSNAPKIKFDLTFDLKGATTNRCRLNSAELEEVSQGGKGSSLLDWDWMGLDYQLHIKPGD